MNLTEIHKLPTASKRQWLRSDTGLNQLQIWLNDGLCIYQIADRLQVNNSTLNGWRKYHEIGELLGHLKPKLPDMTRPPAYRIIEGVYKYHRGDVLEEFDTIEELWDTKFVREYYASYGYSPADYYDNCVKNLAYNGECRLSNTFYITYCSINKRGIIKALIPPKTLSTE